MAWGLTLDSPASKRNPRCCDVFVHSPRASVLQCLGEAPGLNTGAAMLGHTVPIIVRSTVCELGVRDGSLASWVSVGREKKKWWENLWARMWIEAEVEQNSLLQFAWSGACISFSYCYMSVVGYQIAAGVERSLGSTGHFTGRNAEFW